MKAWDALRVHLGPSDVLIIGLRFTHRTKDFEADAVLLLPEYGVEVRGGQVWPVDGGWMQHTADGAKRINPALQAMECKYGLRKLVERAPAGRRTVEPGSAGLTPWSCPTAMSRDTAAAVGRS